MAAMEGQTEEDTKKRIRYAYVDSLQVQDACNLSGIVISFANLVPQVIADCWGFQASTNYKNSNNALFPFHPVSVLFASKIHGMAGLGISDSERYGLAYEFASLVASGGIVVGTETYYNELAYYFENFQEIK